MSDSSSTYHSVRSRLESPDPAELPSEIVELIETIDTYHIPWRVTDQFWIGGAFKRSSRADTEHTSNLGSRTPSGARSFKSTRSHTSAVRRAERIDDAPARSPFKEAIRFHETPTSSPTTSSNSLSVQINDHSPTRQLAAQMEKVRLNESHQEQTLLKASDSPLTDQQFLNEPFGHFDSIMVQKTIEEANSAPTQSWGQSAGAAVAAEIAELEQALPVPPTRIARLMDSPLLWQGQGPAQSDWGHPTSSAAAAPLPWHTNAPENAVYQNAIRPTDDQVIDQWQCPPPPPSPPLPENSRFNVLFNRERARNSFSRLYETHKSNAVSKKRKKKQREESERPEFLTYGHRDALTFAANSWMWTRDVSADLPILPPHPTCYHLPNSSKWEANVPRAYYRVLADKERRYVLIACHLNLHAFHRGDLRFVEVNDRTVLTGLTGHSVIGNLFDGDVVAVTKLCRLPGGPVPGAQVHLTSQDAPLTWMVERMTLLPRHFQEKITFSFLGNGKAIAKGFDEAMSVLRNEEQKALGLFEENVLYSGTAFLPDRGRFHYTIDYPADSRNQIKRLAAEIASYPMPTATLFDYSPHSNDSMFRHGTIAYHPDSQLSRETRERTVETCILMGYSAANTIFNGRFDGRCFPVEDVHKEGTLVRFSIANPKRQPTAGMWNPKNRVCLTGHTRETTAVIESVVLERGYDDTSRLRIAARLARDAPRHLTFDNGECMVYQKEAPDGFQLDDGFFSALDDLSNGRRIIETLYGASPILQVEANHREWTFSFPGDPAIPLNEYQNEYVRMFLDENPMVLGSSPFGCGKSMTIITAAIEIHKRNVAWEALTGHVHRRQQLLITQSNYASVNLVEIAKKATHIPKHFGPIKWVRFLTEENWKRLPENCLTDYDLPKLMQEQFHIWATGGVDNHLKALLSTWHIINMVIFLDQCGLIDRYNPTAEVKPHIHNLMAGKRACFKTLIGAFFTIYRPDVIMTTADSSGILLKANVLQNVSTIQIDEASQVPEYTLMNLLAMYSSACFGLIGDVHQLPPFCQPALTGRLKEYGIGNTMERALQENLFPKAVLHYVYRCHPVTTRLLSELFYDGNLISGVTENDRNEFLRMRADVWPNPHFPIMIIDNESTATRMGTSTCNQKEAKLVKRIVASLTRTAANGYRLDPKDIGVISFYAAQTSVLMETLRGSGGVKCGTVDAFQGSEREVLIVCCTNERLSEFMQLSNRLNVALSRARQATIIIGSVEAMRNTVQYWATIADTVRENQCLIDSPNCPF